MTMPFQSRIAEHIIEEIALFLSSGVHVLPALNSLEGELKRKQEHAFIAEIRERVEQGIPLWQSLADTHRFHPASIALIRIGEMAGTLPEHMKLLVDIQEKNRLIRQRIASAALYPALVFGIALIVGGGVALFILPRLAQVFAQLNVALPPITRFFLWIGTVVGWLSIELMFALVLILIMVLILLGSHMRVRQAIQALFFHLPGLHRMIQEVEVGRFGYLCGTMLSSGVPLLDVINAVADSAALQRYRNLYRALALRLDEGLNFTDGLAVYPGSSALIPHVVQGMIAAGEGSGLLPDTLTKIGLIYEARGETTAKNLTTLLEPILLLIVWFAVLLIAIAVILPIYSLIGELQVR